MPSNRSARIVRDSTKKGQVSPWDMRPDCALINSTRPESPPDSKSSRQKSGVLFKHFAWREWSSRVCTVRRLCGDEFVRVLFHVLVVFHGREGLECSVHDFAQRWVNMDRVANRLVRSIPRIHQRYDLVYQNRCVWSDDVGSKDSRCLSFNDNLDEVVFHVHRFAFGRILVLLESDKDLVRSIFLDRLFLS